MLHTQPDRELTVVTQQDVWHSLSQTVTASLLLIIPMLQLLQLNLSSRIHSDAWTSDKV